RLPQPPRLPGGAKAGTDSNTLPRDAGTEPDALRAGDDDSLPPGTPATGLRHHRWTGQQSPAIPSDRTPSYFFLPFLPPIFLAGGFLAGGFFAGGFFAGAFLTGGFFAGAGFLLLRLLPPTWRSLRATSPSASR